MKHVQLKHGIATVTGQVKPETLEALDEMMEAAEKQMTREVKTRPILFSTAMVKAILESRKSQTRRVVTIPLWLQKMKPDLSRAFPDKAMSVTPCLQVPCADGSVQRLRNPWHWPEPCRIWVRETHYRYGYWRKDGLTKQGRQRWRFVAVHESRIPGQFEKVYYEATSRPPAILTKRSAKRGWYKRPSIFLPFALARIVNEITDVKVERLSEISDGDVAREGITWNEPFDPDRDRQGCKSPAQRAFRRGWDKINGKRKGCAWADDPWLFVISFRRIQLK